jgi:hypothetical protein
MRFLNTLKSRPDLAQRAFTTSPRAERSAALGTCKPNPVALKGQNELDILPFQGDGPCFSGNPGRRFALPWASMLMPHSGRWTRVAEIFWEKQLFQGDWDRTDLLKCFSFALPRPIMRVYYCVNIRYNFGDNTGVTQ